MVQAPFSQLNTSAGPETPAHVPCRFCFETTTILSISSHPPLPLFFVQSHPLSKHSGTNSPAGSSSRSTHPLTRTFIQPTLHSPQQSSLTHPEPFEEQEDGEDGHHAGRVVRDVVVPSEEERDLSLQQVARPAQENRDENCKQRAGVIVC